MTPRAFLKAILAPKLIEVAPIIQIDPTPPATRLLLAIAAQESNCAHRYQIIEYGGLPGAARGWFQFEAGGVKGVITNPQSQRRARAVCEAYHVEFYAPSIWRALEGHDALAVAFARLLLWSDPAPLPSDEDAAWDYYKRNWRPGQPFRNRWSRSWAEAVEAVNG